MTSKIKPKITVGLIKNAFMKGVMIQIIIGY